VLKILVVADQRKIACVRRDETGAARPGGENYENVVMEIANLAGQKTLVGVDL
jgi:hypothetical protein